MRFANCFIRSLLTHHIIRRKFQYILHIFNSSVESNLYYLYIKSRILNNTIVFIVQYYKAYYNMHIYLFKIELMKVIMIIIQLSI